MRIIMFLACLAALLLILTLCVTERRDALKILDRQSGQVWRFPVPREGFSIGYTHSVMKTDVEELFSVRDGLLVLTETVYQSYGVGLPFLPEEGELTIEEGKFILEMHREAEEINMHISSLAGHWLQIGGERCDMTELLGGDGRSITLSAEKRLAFKIRKQEGYY